jgi:hypothetical protein
MHTGCLHLATEILVYAPEGFPLETFISQSLRSSYTSGAFIFIVLSIFIPYRQMD